MFCQLYVPTLSTFFAQNLKILTEFIQENNDRFFNKLPRHVFNVTDYCVLSQSSDLPEFREALVELVPSDFKHISLVRVPANQLGYLHRDPDRRITVDIGFSIDCENAFHLMCKNDDPSVSLTLASFNGSYVLIYDADQYHRIDNRANKFPLNYLSLAYDKRFIDVMTGLCKV